MTEETKAKLFDSSELNIVRLTKSVDEVRHSLDSIQKVKFFLSSQTLNNNTQNVDIYNFQNLERLAEYRLLIGLLILDITSSVRIYLNAKYKYESIFSVRQIIVIINEGYKKIYNFITKSPNGEIITRYRKNSFWVKDIGNIVTYDLPDLQPEYDVLTIDLEDYFKTNFDDIKKQRDLSVHYDDNPIKVYDMLLGLDIEQTYQKLIPFLDILNKMYDFTDKICKCYAIRSNESRDKLNTSLDNMIDKLEKIKSLNKINNDLDFISDYQDMIRRIKEL